MKNYIFLVSAILSTVIASGQNIINVRQLSNQVNQYEKIEFDVDVDVDFKNPFEQREVMLDMVIKSPSGRSLMLPCYYTQGDKVKSRWKARFTPQENGSYTYHFRLAKGSTSVIKSETKVVLVEKSNADGILHINDYWTLRFDSGKPFRGIGENVGWEARAFEDSKYTFDYLLPTLAENKATFFRLWLCPWSLPVEWKTVKHTTRYTNSSQYFNEGGVKRMDQLVRMSDSLGLHFMLSIDYHGAFIASSEWNINNYNKSNGGVATRPADFFQMSEAKALYKNKLRYLVARWGYSPAVGAWEFFNEIDNAVFTAKDSVLIPHAIITQWHDEMSTYLKQIDPYGHVVTTSISHRDIKGMNELPNIDLNQKHIYNHTDKIAGAIREYTSHYKKPYSIGEFGYDWNWDNVKPDLGTKFDFDYKRGLWYGMFSPTPILPMTWWWEFFDGRNMIPYFRGVAVINDEMLKAGNGVFETATVNATGIESYALKCGDTYFVYLLNNSNIPVRSSFKVTVSSDGSFDTKTFSPLTLQFENHKSVQSKKKQLDIVDVELDKEQEVIYIIKGSGVTKR